MDITFQSAVNELKKADKILILTHINPDGDTLGSGYALLRALLQLGKRARLINGDRINEKYAYLSEKLSEDNFEPEYIVSVDIAERKLLGQELSEKYGDRVNLAIDHHESSRRFAQMTYCEADSASCCEIVYLMIKELGAEIDGAIAGCIYTGCSTDTGCFKYSNVTPRTHKIAAELIEKGAPHSKINEIMFDTKTMNSLMFERMCLETLEIFAGGRVAVISVTGEMLEKCGVDKSALDSIKPLTRQIQGVEIGVTVKQEDSGAVGVSVRTGESYDASAICGHFGGGGHIRASGCELKGLSVAEVKDKVISYILSEVL